MHGFGQSWHALNCRRTGSDDADALVGQPGKVGAGVFVVPAAGVECMTAEPGDPRYSRQFRLLQVAVRHRHKPGADLVAAVGGDQPAGITCLPANLLYLCLQTGVTVQVVMLGDPAAVGQDFSAFRILLGRHIPELLEQRHIDVGLDVAGDSGVTIPIPGPANVGGLVDQPDVVDTELPAPGPDEQPAEAGTDDGDVDLVADRVAVKSGSAHGSRPKRLNAPATCTYWEIPSPRRRRWRS